MHGHGRSCVAELPVSMLPAVPSPPGHAERKAHAQHTQAPEPEGVSITCVLGSPHCQRPQQGSVQSLTSRAPVASTAHPMPTGSQVLKACNVVGEAAVRRVCTRWPSSHGASGTE